MKANKEIIKEIAEKWIEDNNIDGVYKECKIPIVGYITINDNAISFYKLRKLERELNKYKLSIESVDNICGNKLQIYVHFR